MTRSLVCIARLARKEPLPGPQGPVLLEGQYVLVSRRQFLTYSVGMQGRTPNEAWKNLQRKNLYHMLSAINILRYIGKKTLGARRNLRLLSLLGCLVFSVTNSDGRVFVPPKNDYG